MRFALLVTAAALAGAATAQPVPQALPAVRLNAGIHNIRAEVARTPEQRSVGLMHRRELGANDGMLFVFEQAGVQCFWMRNTLVPLSIYFNGQGRAKVELALAKGKNAADKRDTTKEREWKREQGRLLKEHR